MALPRSALAGLTLALGLALGWGPRGMWLGLTAGLTVAAFLMARRFLRSSLRVPIVSPAPSVTVTDGG